MISLLSSLRIPRLVLSLSLVFWVSGAGCLIGCENMVMAAVHQAAISPDGATVVASESCAHAADHSCCAKHRAAPLRQRARKAINPALVQLTTQTNEAVLLPLSDGTMNMCPLAMNAGTLASATRTGDSTPTMTLSPVELPADNARQTAATSPLPAWFSNRGHTYLRCCVFLI